MRNIAMHLSDLGELYILLEMYIRVYEPSEDLTKLLLTIKEEYEHQAQLRHQPMNMRNPRNAGRKPKYSPQQNQQIIAHHENGMTIRTIASTIPCSIGYVQKLINEHKVSAKTTVIH